MKNQYEVRGDVIAIIINSPKYGPKETIISTSQLERVKEFPNTWYVKYNASTKSFYAIGNITLSLNKRRIYGIHQWIKGFPVNAEIDHINHDTLDNTDSNLRIVTSAENMQNRKSPQSNNSSGVRGVYLHKSSGKWTVQLRVNGRKLEFGYYSDIAEAERVAIESRKIHMPFSAS